VNISDILRFKGSDVVTIAPSDTVSALLASLAEHNVGALLVSDGGEHGELKGIVSERDVVRRFAEHGAELLDLPVERIMTSIVVTCTSKDTVDDVGELMTQRRVRHLPVVDDGQLVGIISIGDVVSSRIRQLEKDRGQLEQYISG
jgi:CBS domain-containing protein